MSGTSGVERLSISQWSARLPALTHGVFRGQLDLGGDEGPAIGRSSIGMEKSTTIADSRQAEPVMEQTVPLLLTDPGW